MDKIEVVITKARQVHVEPDGRGNLTIWITPEEENAPMKNVKVQEREV